MLNTLLQLQISQIFHNGPLVQYAKIPALDEMCQSPLLLTNFQKSCVPIGFGPPANCGNFENRICICRRVTFTETILPCQIKTCYPEEFTCELYNFQP